jgi:anti-sigma factor RsiW
MTTVDDVTCRQVVAMVTEYLDGALSPDQVRRFEEHVAGCLGCETYLDQMRRTVGELSRLGGTALPSATRDSLLAALRARTGKTP